MSNTCNNGKDNALSPTFQIITIFFTCMILTFFTYKLMFKFCAHDKLPDINLLLPKDLEKLGGKPLAVKVGLTIDDFSEFDTRENNFTFFGIIWFSFDPGIVSNEVIENFTFSRGEILEKSKAYSYLVDDKIMLGYNIRVAFKTNLYYGFFPFEDHKIYIVLENNSVSLDEMLLKSDDTDLIIKKDVYTAGWNYSDHEVYQGYGVTELGGSNKIKSILNPRVIFQINYSHSSIRFITMILLPLILIFLIELFSLCVDQKKNHGTLLGLSSGHIAALYAYRFVIESIAPKVAYLTISDYLFFLFLSTSFIMFLINGVGPYLTIVQKKLVSVGLQLYVIMAFLYLFNYWAVC